MLLKRYCKLNSRDKQNKTKGSFKRKKFILVLENILFLFRVM